MKKVQQIILYIVIAVLAVSCGGRENGRVPQPSDTLYTAEMAMEVFNQDLGRALVIIDSALLVGNIDDDLATMLKAKIYSQSNNELYLDTAQRMLEGLMESNYVKDPEKREVVLDLLVSTTRLRDDYEQCLRWATEKADLCRAQGKKTEALRTEAEIGVVLVELGEEKEGVERLNSVIASLDGQRQIDETDACIIAIRRKINVLKKLDRVQEIIPLAQHLIEIIGDYREHYDQYTDNSYRMPTDKDEVEDYCDYYAAQANGYLAYAYASLGDTKQARHYLKLFEKSDYGSTLYGRVVIAPTWCLLGDYDKMLATYDEATAQMVDDTVNLDYAKMLRGRAIAAKARGNSAAATGYWQRYSDLKDLLHSQLLKSKAHEYAARYQLQEERLNTEREEAAKNRMGIIASLLGALLFIVAVFATLLVRQLHSIREKNAVLSNEIAERIEYEEKYQQLVSREPFYTPHPPSRGDEGGCSETATVPLSNQEFEELSDGQLYEFLRRIILEERLFLDPQFGRQQLMDRLHLSKESIGAAFSKGSQYASLASFVNEMRLIHGAKLLSEHPEMSISDVATASGFGSNITFSHNFKERYALTPTEFRNKK